MSLIKKFAHADIPKPSHSVTKSTFHSPSSSSHSKPAKLHYNHFTGEHQPMKVYDHASSDSHFARRAAEAAKKRKPL